jgi:hypothetical chaperone protein
MLDLFLVVEVQMYIGFDYGTANCSVAIMQGDKPELVALEAGNPYIPSTICAPTRESVSEDLFRFRDIKPSDDIGERLLRRSIAFNKEEDIRLELNDVHYGEAALTSYLQDPSEVYYVKSPKSFLGASGLHENQLSFFEDLVCSMMANIKYQAEKQLEKTIHQAVIGRPINFHGRGGEAANRQAVNILSSAAKRAGFEDIQFQYEPVAAGLEYEASLTQDMTVLVVDIGGGTTDCSLIQMGPSYRALQDRSASLLAHSGQRVGGNDLDIYLAFKRLMPAFGLGSKAMSGIEMPITQFWNPIAINNVEAQKSFYASQNLADLKSLQKMAQDPSKLSRLLQVYFDTLGHHLVRKAEEAKIALSDNQNFAAKLAHLSDAIEIDISQLQMIEAIDSPKSKMIELVKEAVKQGQAQPDAIFMTGGSARSPILRDAVQEVLPDVPVIGGNYFGSVTAGLARWAQTCYS